MKLEKIELYYIKLALKEEFSNSKKAINNRDLTIIKLINSDKEFGFGEIVGFETSWYIKETQNTSREKLIKNINKISKIKTQNEWNNFLDIELKNFPGLAFALDTAYVSLKAKENKKSLKEYLNIKENSINAGIVFGLLPKNELMIKIDEAVKLGYKRVKIKVSQSTDLEIIKEVQKKYPNLVLCVDANRSFELKDIDKLKELDNLKLKMIEEPFKEFDKDLYKKEIQNFKTDIFLDETYESYEDIKKIISQKYCSGFTIKACKIGRIERVIEIINLLNEKNYKIMIGSMFETSLGKTIHSYLATFSDFLAPDLSDYRRYFKNDILVKNLEVKNGKIELVENIEIDEIILKKYCYDYKEYEV